MPHADVIARARRAIASVVPQLGSPFAAAELRVARALGLPAPQNEALLAFWQSRHPGSRVGDDRYRWEISHKHCHPGSHVLPQQEWRLFRPDIDRDGDKVELALSLPVSITEITSLLDEVAEREDDVGASARALLAEAEPLFRRDLALHIAAARPWPDTFALRCLVERPRALVRFGPIALAIATSYAALAQGGFVVGMRNPYYDKPLASATAQLATGLLHLGVEMPRLASLVRYVRGARRASGAWGDPHEIAKLPKDELMTTLACAALLVHIDPSFDPEGAIAWLAEKQEPSGFFCAHGPEVVWLTGEVLDVIAAAARPFPERFTFPHVPAVNLDRKTGLPFFAYFDDLARLFAELPGVAETTTQVAFIDLAGFRAFNNAHGQDTGDAVLAEFAAAIRDVPGARAVRDGGDEFLVVGAPTRTHLARDLDRVRTAWPKRFRERFPGATPVAPRVLVGTTRSAELRACRELLGRSVSAVKERSKSPPPEGVLEELG
jgi:GGDEF domain-containing protein